MAVDNCLFKGSFNGSGKFHPVLCRSEGVSLPPSQAAGDTYYLHTAAPTEDAAYVDPSHEGVPVSATYVPFQWSKSVTAVDGNVYYKSPVITLTPATGDLLLSDGDILTGTGGPDTHVVVADGATVILRDVTITNITADVAHAWSGISCAGDATIILEGRNVVKGGHPYAPGIYAYPGKTLTIQGNGALDASSNGFGAGIGGGRSEGMNGGNIVIAGGTIIATGGQYAAGIGGGYQSACGNISIGEGVTIVTAVGGAQAPNSVGAGYQGTCGTVTVNGVSTGGIADNPYVYNPCILTIASTADWNAFASRVNRGLDSYDAKTVTLAADIPVTTIVGSPHPFKGVFNGGGHTLTVAIVGTNVWAAPFFYIDGATISNLTVTGSVTAGGNHAAGLVGACGASRPNTIRDCTVAVDVVADGNGYAGGIVGQGGDSTLTLDGCVFSGSVSGFTAFAGGLLGWGNTMTLNIANCLVTGTFTPLGAGKFHPIACKFANRTVTATVANAYWINTLIPTARGGNLVSGAEGTPVSATLVPGEWAQPVTAADGLTYYRWTTAPAGRLLARYAFDDAGNGGANLLRASVGLDAIVRATQTTPVAGIGNLAAVSDAALLSGLPAGDGAVAIPNGQHLAVPVPAPLLSAPGRPYTVVMKIRVPNNTGWRSLINMPASNDTDAMIYLHQTTRNIYLKQFDKSSGAGIAASNGNVAADQWTTLAFAFGENATDVYRDGTHVLHTTGALAGSFADCAAAGGYILVGADDSYDDDLFYLSDFRVYEGAVAVAGILPGLGTPSDPYLISSTADWNVFAANVGAGFGSAACYRLGADVGIATRAGADGHPFSGTFDGAGHTLTAGLSGSDYFVAPFSVIGGATISNLVVAGTEAGNMHCAGLVGCANGGPNMIENCKVAAAITSSGSHFGGVIGHDVTYATTLRGCVFSGSLSGGTYVATFNGRSDDGAAMTLIDCLDASESAQPIGRGADAACVSNTYYKTVKNFGNAERLWSENNRGRRAYSVTGGEGVLVGFGTPKATYGTAGITAYAKGLAYDNTFYAGQGDAVWLDLAATPPSGMALDAYVASAGTLSQSGNAWTLAMPAAAVVVNATWRTGGGFTAWAAANGVTGAWDATDASGVHNVFRYAFDKPTGAFTNPPLLSISFDALGRAVIHTPPLNSSATGFDVSILATADLAGTGATTYPLDADGETTIPATNSPARFFRLQAVEE